MVLLLLPEGRSVWRHGLYSGKCTICASTAYYVVDVDSMFTRSVVPSGNFNCHSGVD